MVAYGCFPQSGPLEKNDYAARPFLQPNHLGEGGSNFLEA